MFIVGRKTSWWGKQVVAMNLEFLGYDLFHGSVDRCADEMVESTRNAPRSCKTLACLNPHSWAVARNDPEFEDALKSACWLIPDGVGVVWAAQSLGRGRIERVTGPDVFTAVMNRLDRAGGSVFFLGSSQGTLDRIAAKLKTTWPNVRLAGVFSPPFKETFSEGDTAAMIDAVNRAEPDILWVGMTAPKQEKWLAANRTQLNVSVAGAIGAAFDFFAGSVRRPPVMVQKLGLEWLPRLIQQPRRLWRRMFISAPLFIAYVLRTGIRRGQQ